MNCTEGFFGGGGGGGGGGGVFLFGVWVFFNMVLYTIELQMKVKKKIVVRGREG